ncbi:BPSS1780 family membrane protein [Pseudoalteromonas aurantia]|uniref:DUF2189 domain-containing protein n=1 Tax=Pseudoalteromonas aurantia 208 TaxID=1314867 RepID=A0ABR9EET3_9GAMM|nr:BPSS1780 family membrane protein [Pseudoalteromonas aurantia]MBE0369495.1 hypothetical protein [Pseudoalteromonas aurantia 208]
MSSEFRVFKAAMGIQWLKAGWSIFKTQPMTFVFMYIFIIIVALVPLVAPLLQLLAAFASPFLTAGMYMAVLSKQQGKTISLADILAPFSAKGRRLHLFRLGLYQMGAIILLTLLADFLFADAFAIMQEASSTQQPDELINALLASISMSDIMVFAIAHCFNLMAFAYALPLVFFKGETRIFTAITQSLKVFHKNMAPLGVYGLAIALLILASMPLSMIPLLVIIPISYISFFVSFQAIFMPVVKVQSEHDESTETVKQDGNDTGRFDA